MRRIVSGQAGLNNINHGSFGVSVTTKVACISGVGVRFTMGPQIDTGLPLNFIILFDYQLSG